MYTKGNAMRINYKGKKTDESDIAKYKFCDIKTEQGH